MKIPMKIFYSGEGFKSETLGEVWLLRARLMFRPFFRKNGVVIFYKPLFSNAGWHRVPLDAFDGVMEAKNPYEAMTSLRSHPDYKSPVL